MSSTKNTRRLVNCRILYRRDSAYGPIVEAFGGAWGRPEDALAAAHTAARSPHSHAVGICITDVNTGERFAITFR